MCFLVFFFKYCFQTENTSWQGSVRRSQCEHATGFCSTTRQRVQCLTGQDLILQINTNATAKKAERRLKCHWITSLQPKQ